MIDDDPAVRMTIKLVLERDGHAVELATDGLAGMKAIKAGGIDLLIVDIFMPGMDGIETIREVHGVPACPPSSSRPRSMRRACRGSLGPTSPWRSSRRRAQPQKPFKPRDIIGTVRRVWRRRGKDRHHG